MGYTNSSGIFVYDGSEDIAPHAPYMNLLGSSLTTRLNQDVRAKKVANESERAAYVTEIGPSNISAANPLAVHRQNAPDGLRFEVTYNGTTWRTIADKEYYDAQAAAQDTGWLSLTPSTPLTGTVQYRRRNGIVDFYADLSGTISSDQFVANIPAGYRCVGTRPLAQYTYGGTGNINPGYINGTSGDLRISSQPGVTRRLLTGTWIAV